jgi:hypothetical protein
LAPAGGARSPLPQARWSTPSKGAAIHHDYDVFISLRFKQDLVKQVLELKAALEKRNLKIFMCHVDSGDSISDFF